MLIILKSVENGLSFCVTKSKGLKSHNQESQSMGDENQQNLQKISSRQIQNRKLVDSKSMFCR